MDGTRRLFYKRLARVSVRHEYYAATGGACRDFFARPTGYTAGLLRRLGLLFREEDDGFSVLYNELQQPALLAYVRGKAATSLSGRSWARLCFALSLRNPWFVNFTELPADTNPACWNLYLTNRRAHGGGSAPALLCPGARVSARDRVPVTGPIVVQPVEPGTTCVRVRAVSGTEVLSQPVCAPAGAGSSPGSPPPSAEACTDRLYFDLGGAPEGLYRMETETSDGAVTAGELLYTAASPVPLVFVELLLADPAGTGGVYPVRGVGTGEETIEGVAYVAPFAARSTWWNYYVLVDSPRGDGEPRIRQLPATGEPRVAFRGPCRVRLPGGRTGWRLVSRTPIALARRPSLHLQLVWRRGGGRADVLVDRLPLAEGETLVRMEPDVPDEHALPCPCDDDQPGLRGRRLREWLAEASPPDLPRRLFSDIYVHV